MSKKTLTTSAILVAVAGALVGLYYEGGLTLGVKTMTATVLLIAALAR